MGIEDTSRKVQGPSQEPVPWASTVTHTMEVVYGLVSQDRWDKSNSVDGRQVGGRIGLGKDGIYKGLSIIRGKKLSIYETIVKRVAFGYI